MLRAFKCHMGTCRFLAHLSVAEVRASGGCLYNLSAKLSKTKISSILSQAAFSKQSCIELLAKKNRGKKAKKRKKRQGWPISVLKMRVNLLAFISRYLLIINPHVICMCSLYLVCPGSRSFIVAICGLRYPLTITLSKKHCYCCCHLYAAIGAFIDKVLLALLEEAFMSSKYCVAGFCVICTQLKGVTVSEADADVILNENTEIEHVSRLVNLERNK